jgi:arsenite-transporting ATPase
MIKEHLSDFLAAQGLDNVIAEELAIIPGFEELFSLIEIKENFDKKFFDVIIVDTAPTASALRLLSFPDIVSWYVRNIFNIQKRIGKMSRRVKNMIEGSILGVVANTYEKIDGIKEILTDRKITTIRIVLNLEKMIITEGKRAYTYLNLFGLNVDSVLVNKIIPEEVKDPYFGKWKDIQKKYLNMIKEAFEPLPILKFYLLEEELVGEEMLKKFGKSIYGNLDPVKIFIEEPTIEFIKKDKKNILKLKLPFVSKEDIDLLQRGEELIIRIGHFKHTILLPEFLKNSSPKEAKFIDDKLNIYF